MSATDPNNIPDAAAHGGYLQRLVRSSRRHVADQAREMGLKVGDVIVGREGGGDPETGWWEEQRLTLKYIGEQCCVWKSEWSNKALTLFRDDGESANWTLSCRDWYLVRPNSDSPSFEHTDMTPKINNAIEALVDALREESPERMTTFRLFVNCEERVIETSERTPAELKAAGISMRNLRGNFIRENDQTRPTHRA